ncbi:MAG: tRNA 2-thiouridine(34) synthase MnmA [Chlamydiales bacterium]|nr:tRNA 2-thiouridine(34) synthase MnmA [Chlamydiales bacterium]
MAKKTVVVGMSGGVDSSVSALLLKNQGFHVIGLFMKNWEEENEQGVCKASLEYEDVIKVCKQIAIPCFSVNFVKEYQEQVFSHFLIEYKAGYTPNPDILCNREIKFKVLLDKALELGADFLATGHYCQTKEISGEYRLLRGLDANKDQSYFLYTLKESILRKVLFPIGALDKKEVRRIALEHNLSTHAKKDSTGICFIGKRNFKEFLSKYLAITPGNFENLRGEIIGRHDGSAYYTIGQRKGLKIGGAGDAWFVVGKDTARNVVIVEQGEDHPALYGSSLVATDISWVSDNDPKYPLHCTSKIRYRQPDANCTITHQENDKLVVTFSSPQKAITPRQSIVFYDHDICLGGAMIETQI